MDVSTGGKKVNTFSGVIATMLVYHLHGKTGSSAVSANGKQQHLTTIYSKSPNLTIERLGRVHADPGVKNKVTTTLPVTPHFRVLNIAEI